MKKLSKTWRGSLGFSRFILYHTKYIFIKKVKAVCISYTISMNDENEQNKHRNFITPYPSLLYRMILRYNSLESSKLQPLD